MKTEVMSLGGGNTMARLPGLGDAYDVPQGTQDRSPGARAAAARVPGS
ncbi:hypothetical protein [Streptomyces cupreus]|uniref:Uncharacterized protein n=1 Tax=Streptomyces cupreus TaxID=2759956 RepID=A0A7X1M7C0_9ACTN|nr:hypothetical protein [Streptomyces cupreus]MBC2900969.1 hypothetical protein [Streptomyces cupreus]